MKQSKILSSHPIPAQLILRLVVLLCVLFALIAGLYYELYTYEKKRYTLIEDRYVRVREQLGRQEMQRLIDQSYTE